MKRFFWLLISLLFAAGLLLWPEEVRSALAASVTSCLSTLAPTLFPFLAVTSLLLRSGAGELLSRPLAPLCRVLRLPACCGAPLLMSFLGGYPAGARGVSLLLEKGRLTPAQAARMMLFSVNAGPAFVVSYAGAAILGDEALGWLLLLSGTLSSLLLAAVTAPFAPRVEEAPTPTAPLDPHPLVSAVTDACRATWTLCGWVVFFSGVTALLRASGLLSYVNQLMTLFGLSSPQAGVLTTFLLEVTAGTGAASALWASPVLLAFGLGFGGLCVHLQLFSLFSPFPGSKVRFFLFRFLHGALSALLTAGLLRLFPRAAAPVAVPASAPVLAASPAGGLSLLLMSLVFLLFLSPPQETVAPRRKV